ncbi:hypothetical protein [Stenotrophomonas sp. VV52]|uniref:hypothetical protein n=1 Tax=Stenotrophomonas sp. VV52 TaxID=2066958 RepID=UPI000C9E6137|nr:hypothetical protein [Stenotrophomonas sp. VV52]
MSTNVFDFRQFQTVRDNVRAAGLNPAPLYRQLLAEQRAGMRGQAVVAAAQKLSRQFRDDLSPGAA